MTVSRRYKMEKVVLLFQDFGFINSKGCWWGYRQ